MPAWCARAPLLGLALLLALAACSSTPSAPTQAAHRFDPETDPYWDDPRWEAALLNAIQSVVHAPDDVHGSTTPALHGEVQFTLVNGDIEHIALAQSTGDPQMDELMLQQVAIAHAPQPTGPHAGEPHDFIIELDMPTPFESFQNAIYAAINSEKVYPKDAILSGVTGNVTLMFNYLDGRASDIRLSKAGNNGHLDNASLGAVIKAVLPQPPKDSVGRNIPIEVTFCYSLVYSDNSQTEVKNRCPTGRNVIEVIGTRIKTTTVTYHPG